MEISPSAWHRLSLAAGDAVHCLFKTCAFSYLTDSGRIEAEGMAGY